MYKFLFGSALGTVLINIMLAWGSRANAHAHREPQTGALACNRPPIQGDVCLTTLFNLEPAPAAQSSQVKSPLFI